MKTILFMATSINGYVTGKNDDTDWVKDTEILYKLISDIGVCLMGKRTYKESVKYNAFPYKNAVNIVMTHDNELIAKSNDTEIFTSGDPITILQLVEKLGKDQVVVIGGGNINSQFLASGLIDEIIIDTHPIIIEEGIRLFEESFSRTNLELIETNKLSDGIVQNRYKVLN